VCFLPRAISVRVSVSISWTCCRSSSAGEDGASRACSRRAYALIVAQSHRARETSEEAVEDDQNERPIKHLRYQDLLRPRTALAAITVGLGAGMFDDLARVPHGGAVGALLTIALLAVISVARRRPGWDWRSATLSYSTTTPILTLVVVATLLERTLG
jgi:hypothetical protein